LDLTDPSGHQVAPPEHAQTAAQVAAAAKAAAAAHAAHLAHLAHLAVVAKAVAKIPTYCGGVTMSTLNTCMAATYHAGGGQDTNGIPNGKGYSASVAVAALSVVTKQYTAGLKAAQARDLKAAQARAVKK